MIELHPFRFFADGAEDWSLVGATGRLRDRILQLRGAHALRTAIFLPMDRVNADALMKLLEKEQLRIDARFARWLAQPFNLKGDLPPIPITKTTPWRHQLQAYHFIQERAGALIAAYMGTGKSKITLDVARNMDAQLMLVICPKKVVSNWPDEIRKHYGDDAIICAVNVELTVAQRTAQIQRTIAAHPNQTIFVIVNHDAARMEPMRAFLLSVGWDLAVVDESHKIADCRTLLAKTCYKLRAAKRLALSGTPFKQTPIDVYGEARFVAPDVFGPNFVRYRDQWAKMDTFGMKVIGVKNEAAWDRQVAKFMFSVGQEVLDLPETLHIQRYVTLGAKAQRVYDDLARDLEAFIDTTDPDNPRASAANAAVRVMKLQQITSGFVKDEDGIERELDSAKGDALAEWFEELPAEEPIVIFARFSYDIALIQAVARKVGRTAGEVSGKRDDLARWKRGDLNVLALQIKAGGEGVDLTRARYCGYFSTGYELVPYEQSLARTHRPGQTRPVTYVHFTARDTIDEQVESALAMRRDVIGHLLQMNRRHYQATA